MSFARIATRCRLGLNASPVFVELHLSPGLPTVALVGMSEATVRESKERVRSAVISSGFRWPDSRLTISISPAGLPKSGASYDLAIAVAVLIASKQLPPSIADSAEFYGELSLSGDVLTTSGLLAAAAINRGTKTRLFVPMENAQPMAALASCVIGLRSLAELRESKHFQRVEQEPLSQTNPDQDLPTLPSGQPELWRAAAIAAAGGHHLLMSGEPGAGKTLAGYLVRELLPPPSVNELIESRLIHDVLNQQCGNERAFRAPHHSVSTAGLIGGTRHATPGEISLAHNGILFLDELPEFSLATIEALRQPLESGEIRISRAENAHTYPARFQLIAAMNPCPCGYKGSKNKVCQCSATALARYETKLSGPLLDRIDIFIWVARTNLVDLMTPRNDEIQKLETLKSTVTTAHETQKERQGCSNARIKTPDLLDVCAMTRATYTWVVNTGERLNLSGRGLHRCLRVARTIADISGQARVTETSLTEALAYRKGDGGSLR